MNAMPKVMPQNTLAANTAAGDSSSGKSASAMRSSLTSDDLAQAIDRHELFNVYQPKVDSHSLVLTGFETLVRWQHPRHGLLGPGQFIPVAERFGLINVLGGWVIREACRQLGVWSRQGLRLRLSVNLSVHQVRAVLLLSAIQ